MTMSAVRGRQRQPNGHGAKREVRARISDDQAKKVARIADACGVSIAVYLDRALAREQLDDKGRPVWWSKEHPQQEALM